MIMVAERRMKKKKKKFYWALLLLVGWFGGSGQIRTNLKKNTHLFFEGSLMFLFCFVFFLVLFFRSFFNIQVNQKQTNQPIASKREDWTIFDNFKFDLVYSKLHLTFYIYPILYISASNPLTSYFSSQVQREKVKENVCMCVKQK